MFHVSALMAGLLLRRLPCWSARRISMPSRRGRSSRPNSPWTIDLKQFLARYALPQAAAFATFGAGLRGDAGWPIILLAWMAVASVLFGCFAALRFWRGWARLRALLAFLSLTAWIALLLGYVAHFTAWVAAHLSFWIFLLLLIALQRWRHGPRTAAH